MSQLFDIQKAIFQQIKEKIPANISFVHEIAGMLEQSYDSAYRRIRGEKMVTLEELYKLCTYFGISVDSLFKIKSGKIVFNNIAIEPGKVSIKEWLQNILTNIQMIQSAKEKSVIYAAKDAPFFHYFQIPELAAFKMFFWEKTLFQFPGYFEKKFSLSEYDQELHKIGRQVLIAYTKIPTIEIWNEDTFYIILRQIKYYWVSGLFKNPEEIWILFDKLETWILHIQQQAEYGYQFLYGLEPNGVEGTYKLYENEIVLNDNTVLVKTGDIKTTFLTYNVINLLTTTDSAFGDKIDNFLQGLIKKSIQISSAAAKERQRFFNRLIDQIGRFRSRIENIDS